MKELPREIFVVVILALQQLTYIEWGGVLSQAVAGGARELGAAINA